MTAKKQIVTTDFRYLHGYLRTIYGLKGYIKFSIFFFYKPKKCYLLKTECKLKCSNISNGSQKMARIF